MRDDDEDGGAAWLPVRLETHADRERTIAEQTQACIEAFRATLAADLDFNDVEHAILLARASEFIRWQTRCTFERAFARLHDLTAPAVCPVCAQSYTSDGCLTRSDLLTYGREAVFDEPDERGARAVPPARCPDCSVRLGAHHHAECCVAHCARCGWQRLGGCACDPASQPVMDAGRARVH